MIGALLSCSIISPGEITEASESVICIAPLNNNTGDRQYDALAEGFADMLAATLSKQKDVKLVERHRLRDLLKEQKISLLGLTDPVTAIKVGKLLKADRICVGGITKPKENFIINVHAYEIDTARLVTSEQVQGKPTEIVSATYGLVNKLCKNLNVQLEPIDPNDIDKNPNASLHFMRGLGFYYAANYDRAIVGFMKVQDLDPSSEKAGYWMALCFMKTEEYEHALIELGALQEKYPKSSLLTETQKLIDECKEHIPIQPELKPEKSS